MSDRLHDELLTRVHDMMNAEDSDVENVSSEQESLRAQAVMARVIESVRSEEHSIRRVARPARRTVRRRILATVSLVVAVVLVAGVLVSTLGHSGRLNTPVTTAWQSGNSLTTKSGGFPRHGTWLLANDSLSGTWQQVPVGPPGSGVTCPTVSACYEMDEITTSPSENAPLVSVSFYASADDGMTWTQYTMPSGFSPTTTLSCGSADACDAGGAYNGQYVLVSTTNGGHSFTMAPLPSTVGALLSLSCTFDQFCGGLTSVKGPQSSIFRPDTVGFGQSTNATFLSTSNGGSTFSSSTIAAVNSLWTLECISSLHCVALGNQGSLNSGATNWGQGVMETTNDGGTTWTSTDLPSGFEVGPDPGLSCADALHCSVTGKIDVAFKNPPACVTMPHSSNVPTPSVGNAGTPDAALETIVQFESSLMTSANLRATSGTEDFGCMWPPEEAVSEIMSTTDGGITWTPDEFPANAPAPTLFGLSCPTINDCWTSGTDQTVQQVPGGADPSESVILGTTNGGATWSTVTFAVPAGSWSFESAFGDGIAHLSCPTENVCVANGIGIADATSLPFYRLVIPSSTN